MSERIDFAKLKGSNVLPSPRGVRLTIMRLCQREQVSLQALVTQIQADPVLAGRIVQIANAMNTNRARPIASVSTASLVLIGVQAVRQVVLGIALVDASQRGTCQGFDYARFWSRSVAMACAAQALGGYVLVAPLAEMFTCGLLADIGRLGLASARPQSYARLLIQCADAPLATLTAEETQLFGYSHVSLAVAMMQDWSFPRLFCDAVLFHEAPSTSTFAEGTRQQNLVHILHMAAAIADLCIASDDQRHHLIAPLFVLGQVIGIGREEVVAAVNQASAAWVEWCAVLQVQTSALPCLSVEEGEPR